MPNPRFTPPFSDAQQKFLAICPKFTSIPSILGSIYIVQHVLRSSKRRQRVFTRLLLAMSCMDLIYSIKTFVSTWPLPASTKAYGAVGTVQTCTAFGFWGHGSSLASVVYNGSLTFYYLVTIRHGWTQSRFQKPLPVVGSWEVILHLLPMSVGWGTAIASLPLKLMNPIGWTCWIGPAPIMCAGNPNIPCVRGENSKLYRWLFFHAILWATFAFVAVSMVMIFYKIRSDEAASSRFRYSSTNTTTNTSPQNRRRSSLMQSLRLSLQSVSTRHHPHQENGEFVGGEEALQSPRGRQLRQQEKGNLSRRFAEQACFFVLAFFMVWFWPMVQFAISNAPSGTLYYPMLALTVIINPFQGAFNALIYIRPRYLRYRERETRKRQQHQQNVREEEDLSPENTSGSFLGVDPNHPNSSSAHWKALISAISVNGDDDEDDWEAQGDTSQQTDTKGSGTGSGSEGPTRVEGVVTTSHVTVDRAPHNMTEPLELESAESYLHEQAPEPRVNDAPSLEPLQEDKA